MAFYGMGYGLYRLLPAIASCSSLAGTVFPDPGCVFGDIALMMRNKISPGLVCCNVLDVLDSALELVGSAQVPALEAQGISTL